MDQALNFPSELDLDLSQAYPEEQQEDVIPEDERYWAARSGERVIAAIRDKERLYFEALARHQMPRMWRIMRAQYYGLNPDDGRGFETQEIGFGGEYGEQLRFRMNEVRSFVKQTITMATGNRPAFQAIATNSDYESLSQVHMSDTLVSYLYEQNHGEGNERFALETAQNFARALTWFRWDMDTGDDVEVPVMIPAGTQLPTGEVIDTDTPTGETKSLRTGGVDVTVLPPWAHSCDPYEEDPKKHKWRTIREKRSKYELQGIYPELRGKLAGLSANEDDYASWLVGTDNDALNTDDVLVRHFYHVPLKQVDESLAHGRYVCFVGDHIVYDGPLPCSRIPTEELCPNRFIGNAFGYSDMWDLCSVNQMIDQIFSDVATNLATFGRQLVVVDEGTDFDLDSISQGIRFLTKQPGQEPPKSIQLADVPPISLQVIGLLKQTMQSLSGLNSVVRGDPSENIKSGTMAALFHSIAIEFNSALQQALDQYREGSANLMLELVRLNADQGVLLQIVGKAERPFMKNFTKQDASGIKRVIVKTANPLLRTTAGRTDIANTVLEKMPGKLSYEGYIQLLTTGQITPEFNEPVQAKLRVSWENEKLTEGTRVQPVPHLDPHTGQPVMGPDGQPVTDNITPDVPVFSGDPPHLHLPEHYSLLCDPEVMSDPKKRDPILAHILWHLRECRKVDPVLAAALHWSPEVMQAAFSVQPEMEPANTNGKGEPANDNATDDEGHSSQRELGVKLPKPPQGQEASR